MTFVGDGGEKRRLSDTDDSVLPDLRGQVVTSARIDWSFLMFTDDWFMRIEMPVLVTFSGPDGRHQEEVDVEVEATPLSGHLASIEGRTVTDLLVSRQGHLVLTLGELQLAVAPSPDYESWHLAGPGQELFYCLGGGQIQHYSPSSQDTETSDAEPDGPLSS